MSTKSHNENPSPDSERSSFMRRYFPMFILGFLLSCVSLSGVVSLTFATYLRDFEGDGTFSFAVTLGIALIVAGSHIAIVRGRYWGAWVMLAVLAAGLVAVAPCYAYTSFRGSLIAIVLLILVALLVFNTRRYREMRRGLAHYREQRRAARKP